MRAMAMVLMIGVALAALPAWAQTVGGAAQPATAGRSVPAPEAAPDDEIVRTMYIMTGAMAGYMFAVMPVTMSAVTAALASGAASMYAYDYILGPAAKADPTAR